MFLDDKANGEGPEDWSLWLRHTHAPLVGDLLGHWTYVVTPVPTKDEPACL